MKFKPKYYEVNKEGSAYNLILGIKNNTITYPAFLLEIDNNISNIHPNHPFYYLNITNKIMFLPKLKSLNFILELLRDESRIIFQNSEEKEMLNSVAFITQKFTYSLMAIFDNPIRKDLIVSPIWISSIGKLFIESISFWKLKYKFKPNQRVKQSVSKKIYKIWKKWSNWSHKIFEYPYIEENILNLSDLYEELSVVLNIFIDDYIESIINYSNDKEINKWLENFLLNYKKINKQKLPKEKFLIIEWKEKPVISTIYIEVTHIQNFFEATGYTNWAMLRYFNCFILDENLKEKAANFSHIDLYKNIDLIKYMKDGSYETFIKGNKSSDLFQDTLSYLEEYFEREYSPGYILKTKTIK